MKKILIIEDELPLAKAMEEKFKSGELKILKAYDGISGLQIAKDEHPDLILLDIIMPKMDGITMLKKLREDEWGAEVKVIILTGLSDDKKISEVEGLGQVEYLIKTDWKIEEILQKVLEKLKD